MGNERRATSPTAPHDDTENTAPPHAQTSDKQDGESERMTAEGQREPAGGKQPEGHVRPTGIRSTKKKTRRGFHHLIPVSRPTYLIGIGLSEAPTICSTRSFAAFLVLKP